MLSAVDGRPSGQWTTGRPSIQSVSGHHQLREMRARGGVYAVMWSEMH